MDNLLLIVDEFDNVIDKIEKIQVHKEGLLHRAFSVFIFNSNGQMLLQQRAKEKYHFPELWSNACCSHPILDLKEIKAEAEKRLSFEMNILCNLTFFKKIKYFAKCEKSGLFENEIDYIFYGIYDNLKINFNKMEVMNYKWVKKVAFEEDLRRNGNTFTPWLKIIVEKSEILDVA